MVKDPFLTSGVVKVPFLTSGVVKDPFLTSGVVKDPFLTPAGGEGVLALSWACPPGQPIAKLGCGGWL
ncbi:MAG: hypothetical protein M3422_21940 [Actinomycetota bacterium]|nr:hypothetical protein [Actinomycetota bacterium]